MEDARDGGRFDWLAEWIGAAALAAGAGFAALKLAPQWSLATALAALAFGYATMRLVRAEPLTRALPSFELAPLEPSSARDELLLDQLYVEDGDELLLEDPLPAPTPDSRVVRLFAVDSLPTAGQLKTRIDQHLATTPRPALQQVPDASDALFAALADLRRSLR